jgi:hypothetical protein
VNGIRRSFAEAFVISSTATIWAELITGRGLAIYLGAPLLACLYIPFLTVGVHAFKRAIAASLGIAVVLGASNIRVDVSIVEWLRCIIVITSLVIALTAIANLLAQIHIPAAVAATITSVVALLWMTWPVWMSSWLTQNRVDLLVPAHPLLAINGVLEHLGSWDHSPIAYRQLTILNQDIPFRLPTSIIPATILHLVIGSLLLIPRLRSKAGSPVEPPAQESVPA